MLKNFLKSIFFGIAIPIATLFVGLYLYDGVEQITFSLPSVDINLRQLASVVTSESLPKGIEKQVTYINEHKKDIKGIVVPHHNIVAGLRASFFSEIKSNIDSQPRTIILVSPNHFNAGYSDIQVTKRDWTTNVGKIKPAQNIIDSLVESRLVIVDDSSFINEHGITSILQDIKLSFPEADIVPIILKRGISIDAIDEMVSVLNSECDNRCLMVASVDFSHEQPALLANLHDKTTERLISLMDISDILAKAEVDSPESLALLSLWSKSYGANHFSTFAHTNSGEIRKDINSLDTTTHIFGYYTKGNIKKTEQSVTFSMAGDLMFARGIHRKFNNNPEAALEKIGDRFFWGTDASIVNFEGALSFKLDSGIAPRGSFKFVFPRSVIDVLQKYNIDSVSLANNHAINNGWTGFSMTKTMLKKNKIKAFGGPSSTHIRDVAVIKGNELNLVIIGVHALTAVPDLSEMIKKYKKSNRNKVIIFPHWGTEYRFKHSLVQERMAHDWIDAGADLIIGAHPHVVQDAEVYKGVPIVYSLGNFLFDQTEWNTGEKGVQNGMTIHGEFTRNKLRLFAIPTKLINFKPNIITDTKEKNKILEKLYVNWDEYKIETPAGVVFEF